MAGSNRPHKAFPASIVLPSPRPRRAAILGAVLLLGGLCCADRARVTGGPRIDFDRYHDRFAIVVDVVDGDTIEVDLPDGARPRTRVRLWGVDTPEPAHHGTPPMHFGPEAAEFARRHLLSQRVRLNLVSGRTRDKFGRVLAYILLADGEGSFNERLIASGYAYSDPRFDHPYADGYRLAEQRARRARLGLWGSVIPEQMPPWRQRYERSRSLP